jgi:hypothetical protein
VARDSKESQELKDFKRSNTMSCKFGRTFWIGLGTVCLVLSQGLWGQATNLGMKTGCGYSVEQPATPVLPQQRPGKTENERSARLVLVSEHHGDDSGNASIVGLWSVTFLLADGSVFDSGYATWHSDGTELMNSGRAPMTGSFCMGAWKLTNQGTYQLNHVALSWDSTGTVFVGPANIRETITVAASGNSYSGSFTLNQYDTNGNLLAHFVGKIVATRITAD